MDSSIAAQPTTATEIVVHGRRLDIPSIFQSLVTVCAFINSCDKHRTPQHVAPFARAVRRVQHWALFLPTATRRPKSPATLKLYYLISVLIALHFTFILLSLWRTCARAKISLLCNANSCFQRELRLVIAAFAFFYNLSRRRTTNIRYSNT